MCQFQVGSYYNSLYYYCHNIVQRKILHYPDEYKIPYWKCTFIIEYLSGIHISDLIYWIVVEIVQFP